MKIVLLAKVPAYFELQRQSQTIFPEFQIQTYWLNALKEINHQTRVFLYSKSIFFPQIVQAKLEISFQKISPKSYAKWQNIKNRLYQYIPTNYVRSLQLLQKIKVEKPEVIIIAGGISQILSFPLEFAKKQKCKIIMLNGEDPKLSATSFEKNNTHLFDWIIVNDPTHKVGWEKLGAKHVLALPYSGVDEKVYKPSAIKKDIPLIFIGSLLKDRQAMLAKIKHLRPKIYGYIPPEIGLSSNLRPFYHGEAWGKKMINLISRANIAINFSPPHMPIGGNLRLFEIPACGAMQITNHCPKEWFEPDKEIVVYQNDQDFVSKIEYYLSHEKEAVKIAKAGHARTVRQYTYKKRFGQIIAL